jgi:transposase
MAGGKHRRKFIPEYRYEAAHLVIDTGRSVVDVARSIGVGEALLGRWVAAERAMMGVGKEVTSESERVELEWLRKEVQRLRMENEFLGKAAAFFASNHHPNSATR